MTLRSLEAPEVRSQGLAGFESSKNQQIKRALQKIKFRLSHCCRESTPSIPTLVVECQQQQYLSVFIRVNPRPIRFCYLIATVTPAWLVATPTVIVTGTDVPLGTSEGMRTFTCSIPVTSPGAPPA